MDLATKKPILVTGGNGFLGAHVVQQLLSRGYAVRAVVRPSPGSSEDVNVNTRPSEYLAPAAIPGTGRTVDMSALFSPYAKISGTNEKLEIVEADLTSPDNWESAFAEVEYVIHTASPYILKSENPQSELMQPAVEGTRRLLELSQKTGTVKKFIYISCLHALTDEFDNIKEYNEDDWNTTSSLTRNPYAFSKTMAEKLVHSFCGQAGCRFTGISILPGILWGPPVVGRKLSFSHKYLTAFLNGNSKAIPNFFYNISDVRDVAYSVLLAVEQPRLSGRYPLCNDAMGLSEILQIVHENFVDIVVPSRRVRDFVVKLAYATDRTDRAEYIQYNLGRKGNISCRRARDVGMMLRPQVQTILDTTRYLLDHGLLDNNTANSINCVIN